MGIIPELYKRYLRVLGIEGQPSGLEGLRLLVRRHLCRVPFENVSKLLLFDREGAGRPFTLTEFLDGIEQSDLGGTCYSANPFLMELLRQLGYDADLHGSDMTIQNTHTSVRVRVDGVPYHVDVGYGGPFRAPMRLDQLPYEHQEGALRYVLQPDGLDNGYEMRVLAGEERRHGYIVHDPPRPIEFFDSIARASFAPSRTFMGNLRLVRIFEDHSVELFNRKLTVNRGGETRERELRDRSELHAAMAGELAMPRCPIDAALDVLERLTGKRLFG